MIDKEIIIDKFKQLSTYELVELASKPAELRKDVIPALQAELILRGEHEKAIAISDYLVSKPSFTDDISKDDLADIIRKRMESGEPTESIRLDLKDKGIDMFSVLNGESKAEEKQFAYLTSLKTEGHDEETIHQKMKEAYGIDESDTEVLQHKLKNRGRMNIIVGAVLCLFPFLFFSVTGRVSIAMLIAFGVGISTIIIGTSQKK